MVPENESPLLSALPESRLAQLFDYSVSILRAVIPSSPIAVPKGQVSLILYSLPVPVIASPPVKPISEAPASAYPYGLIKS